MPLQTFIQGHEQAKYNITIRNMAQRRPTDTAQHGSPTETEGNYHTKATQTDALSRVISSTQRTRPKSVSRLEKKANAAQKRPHTARSKKQGPKRGPAAARSGGGGGGGGVDVDVGATPHVQEVLRKHLHAGGEGVKERDMRSLCPTP